MSQLPAGKPPVIRISAEEASSTHVDDLLRRQASLRGEGGITRDRKSKWYYKNWFVFMVAGALAGFAAWALLEPYLDDALYVQGTIDEVSATEVFSQQQTIHGQEYILHVDAKGYVTIRGQKIWILDKAKALWSDGNVGILDRSTLRKGQTVGVYVADEFVEEDICLAAFVVPDPPPDPPQKASYPLRTLAAQTSTAHMAYFAVVAALIGMAIGAADGILCRLPRRALLAGAIGLGVGIIGGFVSGILANIVYAPITRLALQQEGDAAGGLTTVGFLTQMGGRALAWALAGMAMGLGQGIALRSGRLLLYGLLGGVVGGLLGGLFFDPVHFFLAGGRDNPSAHLSRLVGIVMVGAGVGVMIGIVELLARDAWLRMVEGPLAGKEFVIFKDVMNLGSSPRSEIYLFNDDDVEPQHAVIRSVGDNYELENRGAVRPACVNGRPVTRTRLRQGDQISIGRTVFVFERRRTS